MDWRLPKHLTNLKSTPYEPMKLTIVDNEKPRFNNVETGLACSFFANISKIELLWSLLFCR